MHAIFTAILEDDRERVRELIKNDASLASVLNREAVLLFHWLYVKDTPLHLAAAGYRVEIAKILLSAGADPNAALNMRHSAPLHYAADGCVNCPVWNAKRQVKTIRCLLIGGADIHARDKNGATALHRAVRTRNADAVNCLLKAGADPAMPNKPGSTPFHLAVQNTGRGGSGADAAIDAQRRIIQDFRAFGVSTKLTDGRGKSVLDCAKSLWIRDLLS